MNHYSNSKEAGINSINTNLTSKDKVNDIINENRKNKLTDGERAEKV